MHLDYFVSLWILAIVHLKGVLSFSSQGLNLGGKSYPFYQCWTRHASAREKVSAEICETSKDSIQHKFQELQNGSDIRGIAVENGHKANLRPIEAFCIAKAFTAWLKDQVNEEAKHQVVRVSVGRDCRLSGEALAEAASLGLVSGGCSEVGMLGLSSLSAVASTCTSEESPYNGGIMITGSSHLPPDWNGMKFFTVAGGLGKKDIQELVHIAAQVYEDCGGDNGAVDQSLLNEVGAVEARGEPLALVPSFEAGVRKRSASPQRQEGRAAPHTLGYYAKCMLGGAIACGLTHTAITPLDVAKCNMQVDPAQYTGLVSSLQTLAAGGGAAEVYKGWAPTLLGYSAQGLFKFGLYEVFKDYYALLLLGRGRPGGAENQQQQQQGQEEGRGQPGRGKVEANSGIGLGLVFLLAAASAEFFADIALCPMEMVKVKMQTSVPGTFPAEFLPALAEMWGNAEYGFPLGSLVPLWSRQIPYTMAKFYMFEKVVEAFYAYLLTEPRESYSSATRLGVVFASGYIAGVVCAVVSHPADTVISRMAIDGGQTIAQVLSDLGLSGVWQGLETRVLMVGTLTGMQWWIYDTFKTIVGLEPSGGAKKQGMEVEGQDHKKGR